MARWILTCGDCKFEFTHSMILDQGAENYFLPEKPILAEVEIKCPNCGHKHKYERSELIYSRV